MSRSCQRATFSSAAKALPRSTRARPVRRFPGDGIALVRHGAAAFLALGEGFLGFQHLGALEMAEFNSPTLNARADKGQRGLKIRHGCRAGRPGWQSARGANRVVLQTDSSNLGRQMRAGADGTGELANGGDFTGAFEALERAAQIRRA